MRHHHGHAETCSRSWSSSARTWPTSASRRCRCSPRRRSRGVQAVSRVRFTRPLSRGERRSSSATLDARRSTGSSRGLAAVRDAGGGSSSWAWAARPGTPATPSTTSARSARLRGLHADRQRLRAHRARQRRGLGHQLLRVAEGLAPGPRRRRADLLRRRRQPEKNVSLNLVRALELAQQGRARGSSASSARTAAPPRQVADACVVDPDRLAGSHHAAHRGAVRRGLAPAGQPPGAQARRHQVGIDEVTVFGPGAGVGRPLPPGSTPSQERGSSSSAAPASSAATSPIACWATAAAARRHALRQLLVGARVALRASRRATRACGSCAATSRTCAALRAAMDGHDVVIHLASNPDIARAATEPTSTSGRGPRSPTASSRRCAPPAPSGSSTRRAAASTATSARARRPRTTARCCPVSTYGASKLAGEALIASYAFMFGLSGCAFRFGNVVGPRQTHGVGFDFVRRLLDATRGDSRLLRSSATAARASRTSTSATSCAPC